MKISKVIPLFKSYAEEKLKNYRPISILPVFSKNLSASYITEYIHMCGKIAFYTKNNLAFKKIILLSMQSCS